MRVLYEEALVGRLVLDSTGRSIGEVIGVLIDTESWKVEALRVRLDRDVTNEIRAPKGLFRAARLDIPVELVRGVADAVLLEGPASMLQMAEQH